MMDLTEIETAADELAAELSTTTSKGQAEMLAWQIQGLANLAGIKATAIAHRVNAGANIPKQGICGAQSVGVWTGTHYQPQTCRIPAGHQGWHEAAQGAQWGPVEEIAEPTKPAVDRLHELVCYFLAQHEGTEQLRQANEATGADLTAIDYNARAETWGRAAEMLEAILTEGGL